ncbi:MAG: hypothetical protein DWQ29_04995 [Planctomycetota bacterium]|nr:MAG: hypothetical protein DWQ29_04995 [Planctomycetota bacterium]REK29763.1 MAG: hypothetical protein DWQ41_03775 [Planctomycetota bacterium]
MGRHALATGRGEQPTSDAGSDGRSDVLRHRSGRPEPLVDRSHLVLVSECSASDDRPLRQSAIVSIHRPPKPENSSSIRSDVDPTRTGIGSDFSQPGRSGMTQSTTPLRRTGLSGRIHDFFYAEEPVYGLALVRMALPAALLLAVLRRWPHVRELYSIDGAPAPLWNSFGLEAGLPIPSAPVAVALYAAMVFFLISSSIGWMTRLSLIASLILYPYFTMLDAVGTITKYTVIGTHALLLLSLSQCGSVWSVDAWIRSARSPDGAESGPPRFAAWPRRLVQLLIGVIYIGAAVTKIHTPAFFSGDQTIFWMLEETNFYNPLGDHLAAYPAWGPIAAYLTLTWEILFLFIAWRGYGRPIMLAAGVGFHFMSWAVLGLFVFPMVVLSMYWSFVNERDVDRVRLWLARAGGSSVWSARWKRLQAMPARTRWIGPAQSAAAFALLAACTSVAAVEIEYRSDPFGERRPEGPYALKRIEPERVAELLRNDTKVKSEDKLFDFGVGTYLVGGILADRASEFNYGDTSIVQCSLVPPHEDMWVEFNLHDDQGRLIEREGQIVARGYIRPSVTYRYDESLPAGRYSWVLRYDGKEIARRDITLGGVQTVSAEVSPHR